ncbi:MAG: excinuclease ABC subunit UvrA, partial [Gammaproteobacteria bacterium]
REAQGVLEVIQDRVRVEPENRGRMTEALEAALTHGRGRVFVYTLDRQRKAGEVRKFSTALHCPDCDIHYSDPAPSRFSFNSPVGACETCRGFGRTMGIDYGLVVPDENKTLADGAIKPWQTDNHRSTRKDLLRFAETDGVPVDVPWKKLTRTQRQWVLDGDDTWQGWRDDKWYGVKRFFDWLESKAYKMHIRVLLSKYRAYNLCDDCRGARLKPEALIWRLGSAADADRALAPEQRFKPDCVKLSHKQFAVLPGLTIHDVMMLPIGRCQEFFAQLQLPAPLDEATELLLGEIRSRLRYLVDVGLGYLTLDRQSRTLSGGEVQRINLTTALGTSLVNTLFVLDEPSIGLHARDMQRVTGVLHRLRDAGNSLLVVEHDAQVMLAADRILDMGPGPGEHGGEVVFFGTPQRLLKSKRSLTARYLSGANEVSVRGSAQRAEPPKRWLKILGACAHNLKNIDVDIPLNRLVCITGVSGSGKSTLMQDVCYKALRKLLGRPADPPGDHRAVRGHRYIEDVVLVDQSPIGKTTRSNPASYVGALDAIRKLFVAEPLARERKYTPGTFSFNSGNGRCPSCGGNGFEHIEMQFLSDVYLRCADCDGRRYRNEVLEVKLAGATGKTKSVADVLDMTVAQALEFFADFSAVLRALEPLAAVGLAYMKLGQPVPTLSGGEAQRLKLAGHLAKSKARSTEGMLFLLDEPTTGLHFEDIAVLLRAFQRLIDAGHSLVIIEHNLDVIQAADWIVDLGPEGGGGGGELVCAGPPVEIAAEEGSHTSVALREFLRERDAPRVKGNGTAQVAEQRAAYKPRHNGAIRIHNAREHNLKSVDIDIPRAGFTVITGISGSGKSTVAFDILFAEGQRRYLESLNAYARQFVQPASRPDVDAIFGIPPTVAIEQRTSRGGRKSTVATATEIYHFLRLLFVKLGTQYCPDCDIAIEPQTRDAIAARIMREHRGARISLLAPLVVARKGYYTDLAKWATAKGYTHLRVDGELTPTDKWPRLDRFREHNIELPVGQVKVTAKQEQELRELLQLALDFGKSLVRVLVVSGKAKMSEALFSTNRACPGCGSSFAELDPRLFSFNSKHGWCERCYGTGLILDEFDEQQTGEERWWNEGWGAEDETCPACDGKRLRPEALAVRFRERPISEFTVLSVTDADKFFRALRLRGRNAEIARDILDELRARLGFLKEVGLGYLTLDRAAPTLSGGEAQRIRLASQLGSNLRGVCYILDEPTIGLHTRDNRMLLETLSKLEAKGNTVVVVEHDEDTIRQAEHVIDLGPGAGVNGGSVVAAGTVAQLTRNRKSLTGKFLASPLKHPLSSSPRMQHELGDPPVINIDGASLHNLKNLSVAVPLGSLVCVTGVSGSGKSTLARDVLHDNLRRVVIE